MHQLTLRIPTELARQLKQAAAEQDRSVNSYASAILSAAVDPELADDENARIRERLARAGILASFAVSDRPRPDPQSVEGAGERAGTGRSLADLVSEGRR